MNGSQGSAGGGSGGVSKHYNAVVSAFGSLRVEHLVAGISGGVISTLVLHPLDLLKIRFAVDDGKATNRPHYTSLANALRSIFRQEGIAGLYKGVTPNVAGAGTAWGFYFLFYNTVKTEMQGGNTKMQLTPGLHMLAAAQAGVLTLAMTNPIWVVKTRMVLQYSKGQLANVSGERAYNGMVDGLVRIAKEEGFRGLYKGFVPGIWGVSHGAVQFMAYEELKNAYNQRRQQPIDTKLSTAEYLFFAALSKLFAAVTTYPYQVVRARLQDKHCVYSGAIDCVTRTFRAEGFVGFYKGMLPNLMRVVPATAITFAVYEKVTHLMEGWRRTHEN